jgi:flagellar motor switch protein FliG
VSTTDVAISGPRKAAVLLLQLGREGAAQIMNRLSPSEVEEITTEIVRLRAVDPDTAEDVLSEFQGLMSNGSAAFGGVGAAQSILEATMGREHASQVLGRLAEASVSQPFAFLADADPKLLLTFLVDEHPQTIALVLAYLRTDQASAILSGLEPETQVAVAQRIGSMESAGPDAVRMVADVLRRRASSLLQPSSSSARVGGVQPLVDIINQADPATERTILESLEKQDPALAE